LKGIHVSLTFIDQSGTYNYTTSTVRYPAMDGSKPVVYAVTRDALAKAEGVPILVPNDCVLAAPRHEARIRAVVDRKYSAGLVNPDGVVMVETMDLNPVPQSRGR
jgi:hypothetical protein